MIYIQIAGTNGKGSVAIYTAEIFKKAGYKCGLYTSPHIIDREERIRVNGMRIPVFEMDKLLVKHNTPNVFLNYTLACVDWFNKNGVEIAVMETGLGGRLDPVTRFKSKLCAITNIGIDHTDVLGDTIEKIAHEKCGIIHEGSTVVCADQLKSVMDIVRETCLKKKAELIIVRGTTPDELAKNMASTLTKKMGVRDSIIFNALKNISIPARKQYIKEYDMLIDGGHNMDALKELKRHIKKYFYGRECLFLVAMMKNKDIEGLKMLTHGQTVFATSVEDSRSVDKNTLANALKTANVGSMPKILYNAMEYAKDRRALLVIAGSFYLAGMVMGTLKIAIK